MNPTHRSIRREIFIILAIKIVLLVIIWKLCFSTPVSRHLSAEDRKQHLIGPQTQETQHGY